MRRKYAALLSTSLLMSAVFLSGCYDKIELEDQAFVLAMGFDKGPNQTIDITVRTAVPNKLSSGGSGGSGGGGGDVGLSGSKPITVRAHTLPEGMNLINTSVERRLSLLHCNVIIFGEELLKDGIIDELRALSRYHEFRQTTFMQMARGKASDVMGSEKPLYEQTDVRFSEDMARLGRLTGLVSRSTIHDFLNNLSAIGEDPLMPILAVNEKVKKAAEQEQAKAKGETQKEDKMGSNSSQGQPSKLTGEEPNFEAGHVIRLGGDPVEFLGTAIFRGDKLVTTLDGIQTRMLLALRGELERVQIEIKSPFQAKKYVGVEISRIAAPRFQFQLKSNPMKIHLELDMEGELYGDQAGTDYTNSDHIKALEQQVNQSIKKMQEKMVTDILHTYQADPFGFAREARGEFLTDPEFKNFPWREKCKTVQVDIKVDFKLRRTGLLLTPTSDGSQQQNGGKKG